MDNVEDELFDVYTNLLAAVELAPTSVLSTHSELCSVLRSAFGTSSSFGDMSISLQLCPYITLPVCLYTWTSCHVASSNYGAVCFFYTLIGFGVGGNIPIDATITLKFLPNNRRFLLAALSTFQVCPIYRTLTSTCSFSNSRSVSSSLLLLLSVLYPNIRVMLVCRLAILVTHLVARRAQIWGGMSFPTAPFLLVHTDRDVGDTP